MNKRGPHSWLLWLRIAINCVPSVHIWLVWEANTLCSMHGMYAPWIMSPKCLWPFTALLRIKLWPWNIRPSWSDLLISCSPLLASHFPFMQLDPLPFLSVTRSFLTQGLCTSWPPAKLFPHLLLAITPYWTLGLSSNASSSERLLWPPKLKKDSSF